MPNIDERAKQWQTDQTRRVGEAVAKAREARNLTASQLAERTKTLGYPIHRVAITKIEKNSRAGKLDVAELMILALALGVPPVELLYPAMPDDPVEAWPDAETTSIEATQWLSGHLSAWQVHRTPLTEMSTNVRVQKARQYYRAKQAVDAAKHALRNAQFAPHHAEKSAELIAQDLDSAKEAFQAISEEIYGQRGTGRNG